MSKKIRPPKVIKHAVIEILPKTKCEDIEPPKEPEFEPVVDVTRQVIMESLFDAIFKHSASLCGEVYPQQIVDMKMHVMQEQEQEPMEFDVTSLPTPSSMSKVGLSDLLSYPENSVCEGYASYTKFFTLTPIQDTLLSGIFNDINNVEYEHSTTPKDLPVMLDYNVNIPKLLTVFDSLNCIPEDTNMYGANIMINPINTRYVNNISSLLSTVQLNSSNEIDDITDIDMMKYTENPCFDMVSRLNTEPEYIETSREWIHQMREIDTFKFFDKTQLEYSEPESRDILMELHSPNIGIISLLEKINEIIHQGESNNDLFNFRLKMEECEFNSFIKMIECYLPDTNVESADNQVTILESIGRFKFGSPSNPFNDMSILTRINDYIENMGNSNDLNIISECVNNEMVKPYSFNTRIPVAVTRGKEFTPQSISKSTEKIRSPIKRTVDVPVSLRGKKPSYDMNIEEEPPRIILSLTTTEIRISRFFEIVSHIEEIPGIYRVIINICNRYKRLDAKLTQEYIDSIKTHPIIQQLNHLNSYDKYIIRVTEDFGPITKMTGGMEYMMDTKSVFYKLIIIDDDTIYTNECLTILESNKTPNSIVSGSGFLFYDSCKYKIANDTLPTVPVDIVEGFAGICFEYSDMNKMLLKFIRYYRTIDWTNKREDNPVNVFLKACFMGDDFIISYFYRNDLYNLYKVNGLLECIHQSDFGFLEDALHKNNTFQSNIGTYTHIYRNLHILDMFLLKIEICSRISYKKRL